jgi:hypothetical protein
MENMLSVALNPLRSPPTAALAFHPLKLALAIVVTQVDSKVWEIGSVLLLTL